MSIEMSPETAAMTIITASDVNRREQATQPRSLPSYTEALSHASPATLDQLYGDDDNKSIVRGGGDLL